MKKQEKKFVASAPQKSKSIDRISQENDQKDWWNEIDDDHQSEIKFAIKEADTGKVISHSEMVRQYKKWLMQ